MGTYTDFTIANYPLVQSKSSVVPEIMTVFRETDKHVFSRKISDRNRLIWGDSTLQESEEVESATTYVCEAEAAIDRLNIMGYTLKRIKRDYETIRNEELTSYVHSLKNNPEDSFYQDQVNLLKSLTFDAYSEALKYIIKHELQPYLFDDCDDPALPNTVRYILSQNEEYYLGFFSHDIRCLIRCGLELVPSSSKLIQDVTELVDGEFYRSDESICQNSIDSLTLGQLDNFKIIVLTEGVTDTQVLRDSLELLYPHLYDFYSFIDFASAKAPGGAGRLASLVKGFAASGIGNKVIAIFDNDSAARDVLRQFEKLQLPTNIAILRYPDLALLSNYPTLGPSGNSDLDVNGLAASIELYFGTDILNQSNENLMPVQWKGYIQSIEQYQGEVTCKDQLKTAFKHKLSIAQKDKNTLNSQDWNGIDAILKVIFGAFSN